VEKQNQTETGGNSGENYETRATNGSILFCIPVTKHNLFFAQKPSHFLWPAYKIKAEVRLLSLIVKLILTYKQF
jgi:hypothetical protein